MTGLIPGQDKIIEIAVLITDTNLNIITNQGLGLNLVINFRFSQIIGN